MNCLKLFFLLSFISIANFSFAQKTLALLGEERNALIADYNKTLKQSKFIKISNKEDEIVEYVKEHGFLVQIETILENSEVEIKDQKLLGTRLGLLKKGDTIRVLERYESGHYKVRMKSGQLGYIHHADFEPSIEQYPLNVLVLKNKEAEEIRNNIPPETRNYRAPSDCPIVQCTSTTHVGKRCLERTINCNGRCHLH